mmetsp:Transcript_22602/g.55745  ORF Transcript_22602/g.55745 Transcript_22602/m.55745 type:complete len:230 (-) Transcript_22602:665-1354(-)
MQEHVLDLDFPDSLGNLSGCRLGFCLLQHLNEHPCSHRHSIHVCLEVLLRHPTPRVEYVIAQTHDANERGTKVRGHCRDPPLPLRAGFLQPVHGIQPFVLYKLLRPLKHSFGVGLQGAVQEHGRRSGLGKQIRNLIKQLLCRDVDHVERCKRPHHGHGDPAQEHEGLGPPERPDVLLIVRGALLDGHVDHLVDEHDYETEGNNRCTEKCCILRRRAFRREKSGHEHNDV